ncbi:MAG: hypothetical protein JXB14_03670 [Candidatus Altiarchaeota archaeon]|nr:hypothetical protein [Candidatus Altiarchaeota archaeon]
MKGILAIWFIGALVLTIGAEAELKVMITDLTFRDANWAEVTKIGPGEDLYVDVEIANQGDVWLLNRKIMTRVKHMETGTIVSPYNHADAFFIHDIDNPLWLQPGEKTVHRLKLPIYLSAPAGTTEVYAELLEADSIIPGDPPKTVLHTLSTTREYLGVYVPGSSYNCIRMTNMGYPGDRVLPADMSKDGVFEFDLENCDENSPIDVKVHLYCSGKTVCEVSSPGMDNLRYFQGDDREVEFTLGRLGDPGDSQRDIRAVVDRSYFDVPGDDVKNCFATYYDGNPPMKDWKLLRTYCASFDTEGGGTTEPACKTTDYNVDIKKFYVEKVVYKPGESIKGLLSIKSDGIDLPTTSIVDFTAVKATGETFWVYTYPISAGLGCEQTLDIPFMISGLTSYTFSFDVTADIKPAPGGNTIKRVTLQHTVNKNYDSVTCDPEIPEAASGVVAYHTCETTTSGVATYFFEEKFIFDHLEKVGSGRLEYELITDSATGARGIMVDGGEKFTIYYKRAVPSMSLDFGYMLLIISLALSLAGLKQASEKKNTG